MCWLAEDREASAHCTQDNGLIVHLYLDKMHGDETALVLDPDAQEVWRDVLPEPVGQMKGAWGGEGNSAC